MPARRVRKLSILVPLALLVVAGGLLWANQTREQSRATESYASPDSRNKLREASIRTLATAVKEYMASGSKTQLAIPVQPTPICSGVTSACKTTKFVDLNLLISRGYLDEIPNDPLGGYGRFVSGYEIARNRSTGEVTISAPRAEGKVLNVSVQP